MIDGQSVLGIIPARGGSKGIPRKNLRRAGGKPLIAWTIDAGQRSRYIDRLVVSTDDAEIMAVAKSLRCDVPFVRPAELAQDNTPGIEPVLHALSVLPPYDWVVLLQPTSPLRAAADIDGCLEACARWRADACVSVTESGENPYWMFSLNSDNRLVRVLASQEIPERRQDLPSSYVLNGAVYVARTEWLRDKRAFLTLETRGYAMPSERSIDIDTEQDFQFLKFILKDNDPEETRDGD